MSDKRAVKVSAKYVTKSFDLGKSKSEKIRALLNPLGKGPQKFWALKGISFEVYEGDVVGIVGVNGSGKSTLLNILSGLLLPTSGDLTIHGDTSMLTIGAGLRGNLTGRENIRLKSLMMGKTNQQIDADMAAIIDFSELGQFIDQPVKDYSSGMKSKLGFAIAVHQDPDILIIDEALSVGDQTFYQKALAKMNAFKAQGKTIFFVSHALKQVREFTDKVMWIQYGELRAVGPTATVVDQYDQWTKAFKALSPADKKDYQQTQKTAQHCFTENKLSERLAADTALSASQKARLLRKHAAGDHLTWSSWGLLLLATAGLLAALYINTMGK